MKIAQFFKDGERQIGIVKGEEIIPLKFCGDPLSVIEEGKSFINDSFSIHLKEVKLAPPITNPSKIIAIGLNYIGHIKESKGKVPDIPIIFAKFPNSIIGHEDYIQWNKNITKKVDYEAELAVVIGKKAKDISEEDAFDMVINF